MQGFAEKKAEKLIRVNVDFAERIEGITISGDFFVHPEECLALIEESLVGLDVNEIGNAAKMISGVMESNSIQLIGITPEIIQEVIWRP
ncbi:MAG: hypothetical protein HY367_04330 [Candidatus Aenigmarchaeota archaeon]|nr:hypothetical protein [Candidatus Aenigmarchaeota archaeon]